MFKDKTLLIAGGTGLFGNIAVKKFSICKFKGKSKIKYLLLINTTSICFGKQNNLQTYELIYNPKKVVKDYLKVYELLLQKDK